MPAPTITGEQVVMFRKTNKKGKPVGKAVCKATRSTSAPR